MFINIVCQLKQSLCMLRFRKRFMSVKEHLSSHGVMRSLCNACAAGDVNSIKVGENTNIQDNTVVHVAKHNAQGRALPTIIGNNVTIGRKHNA